MRLDTPVLFGAYVLEGMELVWPASGQPRGCCQGLGRGLLWLLEAAWGEVGTCGQDRVPAGGDLFGGGGHRNGLYSRFCADGQLEFHGFKSGGNRSKKQIKYTGSETKDRALLEELEKLPSEAAGSFPLEGHIETARRGQALRPGQVHVRPRPVCLHMGYWKRHPKGGVNRLREDTPLTLVTRLA